jgi:hypothetical protein
MEAAEAAALDEDFADASIEAAALASQGDSSPTAQAAMDYLSRWSLVPSSIVTALRLLMTSQNQRTQFWSAMLLDRKLCDYWGLAPAEICDEFRANLLAPLMDTTFDRLTFDHFAKAVAHVAVLDWPDRWPDFMSVILCPEDSERYRASVAILAAFCDDIQESTSISDARRQALANGVNAITDTFVAHVGAALDSPSLVVHGLHICRAIVRWCDLAACVSLPMIRRLSAEFLADKATAPLAADCLSAIFLQRTDSDQPFTQFGPLLLFNLATGQCPGGQPVTSDEHVLSLVFALLMPTFRILANYFRDDVDPAFLPMAAATEDLGLSRDDMCGAVVSLLQVILSCTGGMIGPGYWLFWDEILHELLAERTNGIAGPATVIIGEAIGEVRQAIYEAIAASADEDDDCCQASRDVWVLLFKCDPAGSLEFLQDQAASPEVCYALGCLEYLNDPSVQAVLMSHVGQLVGTSDDPQFNRALLFAFSRSTKMFPDNPHFLDVFLDFISGCIVSGERVVTNAASHALEYVIGASGDNFAGEATTMFLEQLCERSETYLTDFEEGSMIRMFQCCWRLLGPHLAESEALATAELLFEPIAAVLRAWYEVWPVVVHQCLEVISKTVTAGGDSAILCKQFLPILVPMADEFIPNLSFDNLFLSLLLRAIGNLFMACTSDVGMPTYEPFEVMRSRGCFEDAFFEYFGLIRAKNPNFNPRFRELREGLIDPAIESRDPPFAAIFYAIGRFSPSVIDMDWLTQLSVHVLTQDVTSDVIDAVIECLSSLIQRMPDPRAFARAAQEPLIKALVASIVDGFHKSMLVKLIELLRSIIELLSTAPGHQPFALKGLLLAALDEVAEPSRPRLFEEFVGFLLDSIKSSDAFGRAVLDFLIILKRATPEDDRRFTVARSTRPRLMKMLYGTAW